MNSKENSPFSPGTPVKPEMFVGRDEQIKEVLRHIRQTTYGKQENVFLAGDRGIGKSSFAAFLRRVVASQEEILGIHVFLGRVSSLEGLVHHVFEELLKESKGQNWFKEVTEFFGKYNIEEVGLFGVTVSFSPLEKDLKELVARFPEAVWNLLGKIRKEKKGLFIILDDINGLVDKPEFAHWYKSFVDEVATHDKYKDFPVSIMLVGLPEKRDALIRSQPSLTRIFRVVEIEKLSDAEVEDFLIRAFTSSNMEVERKAMSAIVRYSSGLPILMHEIGEAVFWQDEDGNVDESDTFHGLLVAAGNVGRKYLDPKVYRALRSNRYKSILRKLGEEPVRLSRTFTKRRVEEMLNESERRVFANFLKRIRDLGIIEPDPSKGPGSYRFVNEIYPIYIWMESQRSRER
jgi:hypothetical protein